MKKILGLSGFIGSGKDTAAKILVDHHGFVKIAFADTLKDTLSVLFGWDRQMLEGSTAESRQWRETVDEWWANRLGIPNLTPRMMMQQIGTDVMRDHFHNEIWTSCVERKIANTDRSIVVTDCRFPNELDVIKRCGGVNIRISRGVDPEWLELLRVNQDAFLKRYTNVHASEWSSVNYDYDYYINNNMDMSCLYAQIRELLR